MNKICSFFRTINYHLVRFKHGLPEKLKLTKYRMQQIKAKINFWWIQLKYRL